MEGVTTRPKIFRTYGSRPLEPTAGDNVQAESIPAAPPYSPKVPKSPSPLASSPGSSPFRHFSASPSYAFAWKAQLRDIDQGLEDDNLSAILAPKNASPSLPSVSNSDSPRPAPLVSDSAPATPSASADHLKRVSMRSPLSSPAHAGSNTASPTREQISSLSISSPDACVISPTSNSSNRMGAKAADTGIVEVSVPGKRPATRKKKDSKKEEQEINKETARMLAGQHVSIKTDWRPKKRSMNALFTRLNQESSDPIEAFSSPGERTLVQSSSSTTVAATLTESVSSPTVTASSQIPLSRLPDDVTVQRRVCAVQSKSFKHPAPADDDSDGSDIMDPQTLLKTQVSQPLMINVAQAKKLEWLKGQATARPTRIPDDDYDGIEIGPPPPQGSAPAALTTGGRSSFLSDAVFRVKRHAHASRHSLVDIRKRPLPGKGLQPDRQEEMRAKALRRAEEQQAASRAAKEANWKRRGGTLKDTRALKGPHVSELMKQLGGTGNGDEGHDESEDEEDRDYCPDIAAQVPDGDDLREPPADVTEGPREPSNIEDDDGNDAMPSFLSQSTASTAASAASLLPSSKPVASDSTPPSSESSDTELAESQAAPVRSRLRKAKRASRRVIVDDEEVENTAPPPDSDAENARPAMDDSDLENMPPPIIQQVVTMETDDEDTGTPGKRKPLKRLTSFSSSSFSLDEVGSGPSTSRRVIGAPGSPRSAPLSELDGGAMSDTDVEPDADFGLGGMSQLFGVNTQDEQSQKRAGGFHRPTHSFDFSTQPTLLPAVQISETKWKVNDEIFLKQQQDGVETRSVTSSPRAIDSFRKPLGNGQNSFFADFESQSWTQPAASRVERASSLASENDMPENDATQSLIESPQNAGRGSRRIQRGRRGSKSPSLGAAPLLASQTLAPTQLTRSSPEVARDAFKVLMSKPRNEPAVDRELVETYMEGEAEESDEEIAFGFGAGVGPKDDDEGADEEQAGEDGHIKDLVDDRDMDEETLAKDKVLEKVQEHTAEDDARALKIAQDAVEGNFRNGRRKRQRGLGEFDSDDSSDDDDESRRPKIEKKRRIDGDKLHEFGKNPETAAFFKVYMRGINDDKEMTYDGTIIPDDDGGDAQSEDSDISEDENGHVSAGKEREIVTAAQLRQEIREKAKPLKEIEDFDPMDINWYQEDDYADTRADDKLEIEVEVLKPTKPRGPPKALDDEWGALASARESGPQDALPTTESQLASFGRGRLSNGRAANGRGAAVTGYSKQERSKMPAVESKARGQRALKATPSALSTLTARTHRSFQ